MRRWTTLLLILSITGVLPGQSKAKARPDLSGTWELEAGLSRFGPVPAPKRLTLTVKHKGDSLSWVQSGVSARGKAADDQAEYVIDGTTRPCEADKPKLAKCTAEWDKASPALRVRSDRHHVGAYSRTEMEWTLREGGQRLQIKLKKQGADFAYEQVWVFGRRPTAGSLDPPPRTGDR
jgi:hypothetical protein